MSASLYNAVAGTLALGSCLALFVALCCFISAIVGWRGPNRKRRLLLAGTFVLMFPVLGASIYAVRDWVFLPSLARGRNQAAEQRLNTASLVKVGDPAPPFRLLDTDGNEFSLADNRGKVVLINFFATWCGPCLMELPHIETIWRAHGNSDKFSLLVIGREETSESVTAFRREHGYSFPIAADPKAAAYLQYAEKFIPRTFLIGPDGRVCFSSTGFSEEELTALKRELDKQLSR
jgi:peroxiredoxin